MADTPHSVPAIVTLSNWTIVSCPSAGPRAVLVVAPLNTGLGGMTLRGDDSESHVKRLLHGLCVAMLAAP